MRSIGAWDLDRQGQGDRKQHQLGGYAGADQTKHQEESGIMAESVYKVIEIVGTSSDGWDEAAATAVRRAAESLRDIRVAEVTDLDLKLDGGSIVYRAKLKVSFKFE